MTSRERLNLGIMEFGKDSPLQQGAMRDRNLMPSDFRSDQGDHGTSGPVGRTPGADAIEQARLNLVREEQDLSDIYATIRIHESSGNKAKASRFRARLKSKKATVKRYQDAYDKLIKKYSEPSARQKLKYNLTKLKDIGTGLGAVSPMKYVAVEVTGGGYEV